MYGIHVETCDEIYTPITTINGGRGGGRSGGVGHALRAPDEREHRAPQETLCSNARQAKNES